MTNAPREPLCLVALREQLSYLAPDTSQPVALYSGALVLIVDHIDALCARAEACEQDAKRLDFLTSPSSGLDSIQCNFQDGPDAFSFHEHNPFNPDSERKWHGRSPREVIDAAMRALTPDAGGGNDRNCRA